MLVVRKSGAPSQADACLIKSVLHNWNDEDVLKVALMVPGRGVLWIIRWVFEVGAGTAGGRRTVPGSCDVGVFEYRLLASRQVGKSGRREFRQR
jgi:hypothetical protein